MSLIGMLLRSRITSSRGDIEETPKEFAVIDRSYEGQRDPVGAHSVGE